MSKTITLKARTPDEEPCTGPYKNLIGALIYISTCTRPDISFAVNRHAQYFSDPSEQHFKSALKILSYLNATQDLGLHLGGRRAGDIRVYADADFAEDTETRQSTTENLIYIGDSLVSWASKKQKLIAASSTEAEFLAVFYTLRDVQFLDQLIRGIYTKQKFPIILYQDNLSTVALIKNQSNKGRTKHFDVKLKVVNTAYSEEYFKIETTPSSEMWADLMTKPVSRNVLLALRPYLIGP